MSSNHNLIHHCPGAHPRAGSSLFELVFLLVVIGILLTTSIRIVGHAANVHQIALNSVTDVRLAETIEHRLRADLKRCRRLDSSSPALFVLTVDDQQSIKYGVAKANDRELIRQVVVANQQQALDRWILPHAIKLNVRSAATPSGRMLARIAIQSRSHGSDMRNVDLQIVEVCDAP